MKNLEQKFCTDIQKWMRHNMKFTFGWEAKVVTNGRFYYNEKAFQKERRNLAICGRHFIFKFPDIARLGTPMDGISIAGEAGYIFIQYHKRAVKKFYVIGISEIEKEIEAGSKSLLEARAEELAYKIGTLK